MGYDMLAENTPFENGAVIARYYVTLNRDELPPDVKVETEFAFDIAFDPEGPARGEPVIQSLNKLSARVVQVINKFEQPF